MFAESMAWVLLVFLATGSGVVGAALLLHWHNRRHLDKSTRYLLDRLKVAEDDLARLSDDQLVLGEYLRRRGLLDEEDLSLLRRELIEIPKQLEAEKNELLKDRADEDVRVIKNTPDTYH